MVFTNSTEKDGRRAAIQFEQVRAVFINYMPKARTNAGEPIRILAVKGEDAYRTLLPEFYESKGHVHPQGAFQAGQDRNYVILRLDAESESSFEVLYHEYTHFLLQLNFGPLPLWLNEGLAEYFGFMQIRNNDVLIGKPSWSHVRLLQTERWLPLDALFAAGHDSPYYNEANKASIFYAESWGLVHYLMLDGKRGEAMNAYIHKIVGEHADPVQTAHELFGDPNELAKGLENCVRAGRFLEFSMKFPWQEGDTAFSSRTLSPAEALAVQGDFLAHSHRPREARQMLNQAVDLDPKLAAAYEGLGVMSLADGDYQEAGKEFSRAVELDSHSALAYFFAAQARVRGSAGSPESMKEAEGMLRKALELNPEFAEAHGQLANVLLADGGNPNEALEHARRAVSLAPGEAQYLLAAGAVLMKMGRFDEAQQTGQRAKAEARNTFEKFEADRLLDSARKAAEWQSGANGTGQAPSFAPARRADAEAPSSSATETFQGSPSGPAMRFQGRVAESSCEGEALYLSVEGEQGKIQLRALNYGKIEFLTFGWEPPANFSPCHDLTGRTIRATYRQISAAPVRGEILSIEILK